MIRAPKNDSAQIAEKLEFAALDIWQQSIKTKQARHKYLKEKARGWYPDLAPEASFTERIGNYEIQVGACSIEKSWRSMAAVAKAAGGLKGLLEICSITFKSLAGKIGEAKAAELQFEERTGSRTVKAFCLSAAEKSA